MNKIGFIGGFDKFDFILNIARILTVCGKKVLLVDATLTQKSRYVVPAINPTIRYITEFREIDVAVGFDDIYAIKEYLQVREEQELRYDYLFIDVDSDYAFDNFNMKAADKLYFVTSFDTYALKKGLEVFQVLENPMQVTKVLFAKDILTEEDQYLNFLSQNLKIVWNPSKIYVPFEEGDQTVIMENQRVQQIKFKKLTQGYRNALEIIAEELMPDVNPNVVKKNMKNVEKGAL